MPKEKARDFEEIFIDMERLQNMPSRPSTQKQLKANKTKNKEDR